MRHRGTFGDPGRSLLPCFAQAQTRLILLPFKPRARGRPAPGPPVRNNEHVAGSGAAHCYRGRMAQPGGGDSTRSVDDEADIDTIELELRPEDLARFGQGSGTGEGSAAATTGEIPIPDPAAASAPPAPSVDEDRQPALREPAAAPAAPAHPGIHAQPADAAVQSHPAVRTQPASAAQPHTAVQAQPASSGVHQQPAIHVQPAAPAVPPQPAVHAPSTAQPHAAGRAAPPIQVLPAPQGRAAAAAAARRAALSGGPTRDPKWPWLAAAAVAAIAAALIWFGSARPFRAEQTRESTPAPATTPEQTVPADVTPVANPTPPAESSPPPTDRTPSTTGPAPPAPARVQRGSTIRDQISSARAQSTPARAQGPTIREQSTPARAQNITRVAGAPATQSTTARAPGTTARTQNTAAVQGVIAPAPGTTARVPGPVRFRNPFDAGEVFEFPAGTSRIDARDAVAELLLQRARERQSGSAALIRNRPEDSR